MKIEFGYSACLEGVRSTLDRGGDRSPSFPCKMQKKLAIFGGSNRNSQPGRFGKATTFSMLSTRGGIFGRASGKNYLCRPIFCKRRMSSKWGDVGLPPRKYIRMWKIAKSEIARIMRGFTLEISQEVYKKCDLASGAPGHRCTTSKKISVWLSLWITPPVRGIVFMRNLAWWIAVVSIVAQDDFSCITTGSLIHTTLWWSLVSPHPEFSYIAWKW